jgi:hypothetical protein
MILLQQILQAPSMILLLREHEPGMKEVISTVKNDSTFKEKDK